MTGELSGWWRRAAAWVIDTVIVALVVGGALWLFGWDYTDYLFDDDAPLVMTAADDLGFVLADAAVACAYYTPLMLRWGGRSLGKAALGIRVVRPDGQPLRAWQVVVRQTVIQYVVWGVFPLASIADYLWPLGDRQRRALHDLAVDTRVVRT